MHLVNHTEEQQDYFSLLPLKTESNLVKANCFISVDLCQCAPAAAGHRALGSWADIQKSHPCKRTSHGESHLGNPYSLA